MRLRTLEDKDAIHMLEWMKDKKVNKYFRFDPETISLDTVMKFIKSSINVAGSYHFAIVDENDEYLGTVSLKDIDQSAKNGEYAIALRTKAQGHGTGKFATEAILEFAFKELELERVYLNVLSDNIHAIDFYQKIGFKYEGEFFKHIMLNGELKSLMWFRMMRCEYETRE
jgi:diamine N-acetyltransferase